MGGGWTWEKADRSYEDINKENVSHRNNPETAASQKLSAKGIRGNCALSSESPVPPRPSGGTADLYL
jgi:hypothetical protein